ncbi:hypothetical protein LSH36_721g00011 [Paralvinella palmiformis]|uniref:Uncharacterized protein n=1 Tax=Paralvinella palmiformis TaxID=53620 RepID=A0AAD9MT69_9ANNE|nr:hypothetical protein LSH36_721g00011 [Paralvinella palmiformis]
MYPAFSDIVRSLINDWHRKLLLPVQVRHIVCAGSYGNDCPRLLPKLVAEPDCPFLGHDTVNQFIEYSISGPISGQRSIPSRNPFALNYSSAWNLTNITLANEPRLCRYFGLVCSALARLQVGDLVSNRASVSAGVC